MIDFDTLLGSPILASFGQDVTYTRKTPVPANGAWDTETVIGLSIILDTSEEAEIRTKGAFEAWVRESDFGGVAPVKGDRITLADETVYTVMDVRPDSSQPADEGGRKLSLRRV